MRFEIAFAVLALLQQSGCEFQDKKGASTKPSVQRPPLHRFVLTRYPIDAGVAFDTQTGQICRTWEWQPGGKAATPDPDNGTTPQRQTGEFAPTCLSLYQKYPSGPGEGIQTVEDQQPEHK